MQGACFRPLALAARAAWALACLSAPLLADPAAPGSRVGAPSPAVGSLPPEAATPASTDARAEVDAAQKLFDQNDMKGALERYERAYEMSHDRTLFVRIAACYKNMGLFTRALEAARRYLDTATTETDRARAREFVDGLAELTSPLWVESNKPGAAVYVDATRVAVTPMQKPVLVDIGVQRIRVTKAGFAPATATVRAPGFGREVRVRLDIAPQERRRVLSVLAAPGQSIWIDDKLVGRGRWEGSVTPGAHDVKVTSPGMLDYDERVVVGDAERTDLRVALGSETVPPPRTEPEDSTPWLLLAGVGLGAAALTAGAIAGGYYWFKSDNAEPKPPATGSEPNIQLGLVLGGSR